MIIRLDNCVFSKSFRILSIFDKNNFSFAARLRSLLVDWLMGALFVAKVIKHT